VGGLALAVSDGGSNNTAIGKQALTSLTTADHNTAVGSNAMFNITTGHGNVAVGYLAAYSLEGGSGDGKNNVAIGREAMELQTTQEDIIAIGYNAMGNGNSTSNSQNTCVGSQAMSDAGLAGYGNTVMGYLSGSGMTSAVHNTLIGRQADTVLTTGDENIVITSYNARTSAAAGTGQIVIGHNIVGKGNNTGLFGGASGVYNEGNTAAWSTVSDERIKKNITDNNIGLEAINKIQVRNFEYRTEDEITELPKESVIKKEGNQVGVIAQEIQEILPDLIKEQTTGCLSVNPDNLTWYLINAVQELSAEIKKLKGE
jgi:trimeric autotransporter adhesin